MSRVDRPEDDWDQHWDEYSDIVQFNPAQRYRMRLTTALLDLGDRAARVVDIGSGQGDFVAGLSRNHPKAKLLGLEFSGSGIEVARTKAPEATFLRRDLMYTTEPPPEYAGWGTHAICSEVLEHVDSPRTLISNAMAYLAPGCRVVVTVPGGPMSAFDRHIGHRKHFTPGELGRLLTECGLAVESATGAGFPFFNIYRCVVILRGQKLADDVSASRGSAGRLARAVMRVFDLVFTLNASSTPWGWQVVATARVPDRASGNQS